MIGRRRIRRWWALVLVAVGTSACSSLLHGVARTVAEEAGADAPPGAPAEEAVPPTRRASSGTEGSPPVIASTYESTPLMGLSTATFARPYSLMGSIFPQREPGCRAGARDAMDFLHPPEGTPVDASGPLGIRVRPAMPLVQGVVSDPTLRSAHAFHSGAVLSGEGRVCGRSFAHYYLRLSLGWSPTAPVAVSR